MDKNLLKKFETAQKLLEEVKAGLINAAVETEVAEEVSEEEVAGRIIYWDESGEDFTDLDELKITALKKLAKEHDITLSSKDVEGIRDEIYAAFYGEEEEPEEVEEDEVEEEEEGISTVIELEDGEEIDLAELNVKELRKFAKDYGVEVSAKDKDGLIQQIIDALYAEAEEEEEAEEEDVDVEEEESEEEEQDEEEEDDEDPEVMYGLDEYSLEDLAEICADHELSTKGKRQALVDRIIKAIDEGIIEVEGE